MGCRILFVAPSAYPLGGVAVWLNYLAVGLRARGFDVVVGLVAGRCHDPSRYCAEYPDMVTIPVFNPTGSNEGRIRALMELVQKVNPQVVCGVNIVDTYAACHRLRWKNQSARFGVAMALHGIAADLLTDLRDNASMIDGVVATNELACRLAAEVGGIEPSRVRYAPYGIDTSAFQESTRDRPQEVLRIAYVGRLEQAQKRIWDLYPIVDRMAARGLRFEIDIVGDGPERSDLERTLAPWVKQGYVQFCGPIPADALGKRVYENTDVLLVLSEWETGPIVIWEAMAAGVAVVTSRYVGSGLERALEHRRNCLMFDVGDLEGAIANLICAQDPLVRAALAERGRELVQARYTVDHSVDAWAAALTDIGRNPRPALEVPKFSAPRGRLDRLFGVTLGETIRRTAGLRFQHSEPGAEWPHTRNPDLKFPDAFWKRAKELDAL